MSAGTERRAAIDRALEHRGIDLDGPLSSYQLKELLRIVQLMGGRLRYGAAVPAVQAVYDTDPDQGVNAAIIFTAAAGLPGTTGHRLSIAYANTGVAGSETVTYAVGADGEIVVTVGIQTAVSTATQVITALNTEDLSDVLTYALKTGNSGAGAVATMAAKALAGGVDGVTAGFVITPAA